MTAAAIASFRARSAEAANSAHGVPVTFRGQLLNVCLAPVAVSLDLDTGGLRQGGEFRCRFLASTLTHAPQRGEAVGFNGRTYLVSEIHQLPHSAGEHVCTLTPGSKQ